MPDAVETLILQALRARLDALVLSPPVPVEWPNMAFTPPVDGEGRPLPYLKADVLWNRNVNRGVADSSTTEHRGIFQIMVVAAANTGLVGPTNIAGAVAAWFDRGAPIAAVGCTVNVEGKPSLGPMPKDGLHIRIPVSIRFYAFA